MAQEGKPGWAAGFGHRSEMNSQNTSYYVLVDLHTKGQSDLFRNSWTSPSAIALFHLDHGIDNFSSGPFWTGLVPGTWREKEAVFPFLQCLVEAQESGGF